jgi:hypothetical protein
METLSRGFKKPQPGDRGATHFQAMEDNIDLMNSMDSTRAPAVVDTISTSGWSLVSNGLYRKLITVPNITGLTPTTAIDYDTVVPHFRLPSGQSVELVTEKVSDTTYYVYTNDTSVAYTVIYTA